MISLHTPQSRSVPSWNSSSQNQLRRFSARAALYEPQHVAGAQRRRSRGVRAVADAQSCQRRRRGASQNRIDYASRGVDAVEREDLEAFNATRLGDAFVSGVQISDGEVIQTSGRRGVRSISSRGPCRNRVHKPCSRE